MRDTIVNDLMRKCGDDVSETIFRTLHIAPTRVDAAVIALAGVAAALGIASGCVAATGDEPPSPEEAADAFWQRLRPMVVAANTKLSATTKEKVSHLPMPDKEQG